MPDHAPQAAQINAKNASLRAENDALKVEIAQLKQLNEVLRLKVDAMARKLFGKSSEKLDLAQLQLVFEALDQPVAPEPPKPDAFDLVITDSEAEAQAKVNKPKRKKLTLEQKLASLPIDEVIIDPDEVQAQPEAWKCIGAEETKRIDYIPGQFRCQKIVRPKYVRREDKHQAPNHSTAAHLARALHRHPTVVSTHRHDPVRDALALLPDRAAMHPPRAAHPTANALRLDEHGAREQRPGDD